MYPKYLQLKAIVSKVSLLTLKSRQKKTIYSVLEVVNENLKKVDFSINVQIVSADRVLLKVHDFNDELEDF